MSEREQVENMPEVLAVEAALASAIRDVALVNRRLNELFDAFDARVAARSSPVPEESE